MVVGAALLMGFRSDAGAGAWLAVAYITLFLGSILAGWVYHAGRPEGIILGYAIALVIGAGIVPFLFGRPRRPSE